MTGSDGTYAHEDPDIYLKAGNGPEDQAAIVLLSRCHLQDV